MSENEIDPLDAFMMSLETEKASSKGKKKKKKSKFGPKKGKKNPTKTVSIQKRLEDGLNTSLLNNKVENKGLSLMQKMGFTVGSGLGKHGEGRTGIVRKGRSVAC